MKKVRITSTEVQKLLCWTTQKFILDKHHLSEQSQRTDMIGGFFDRWISRISEVIVAEHLFRNTKYVPVTDNLIYGNDTPKDAPDLIGVSGSEKTIPFFVFFYSSTNT